MSYVFAAKLIEGIRSPTFAMKNRSALMHHHAARKG
jgi:hypothetical protein